tara:strand:- start:1052 stop:1834 length:783 start_codon:yes stop_codon:yes gene_type:complete
MLISIITPTYKRLNYIKKNLKQISLIQKKFKNIEWIVVIESKDKATLNFFKKRKKKFIKTLIGKFGSAEVAYEKGIKISKGKYLNLHGDDDFFNVSNFNLIDKNLFEKNFSWIVFDGSYIDTQFRAIRKPMSFIKTFLLKNYGRFDLTIVNFLMTPSIFIKKKIYFKLGGLGPIKRSGSDYVFWMKLSKKYSPRIILKKISFTMMSNKTITGTFRFEKYIYLFKNMIKYNNSGFLGNILITASITITVIYNFFQKKNFFN